MLSSAVLVAALVIVLPPPEEDLVPLQFEEPQVIEVAPLGVGPNSFVGYVPPPAPEVEGALDEQDRAEAEEVADPAREETPEPPTSEQEPAPANYNAPWEDIARCESGYGGDPDWSINTGNGFYGGLQFEKASWDWAVEVGGHSVPEWPHHATRGQQIDVAETLLSIHPAGIGAWPACADKLGLR